MVAVAGRAAGCAATGAVCEIGRDGTGVVAVGVALGAGAAGVVTGADEAGVCCAVPVRGAAAPFPSRGCG